MAKRESNCALVSRIYIEKILENDRVFFFAPPAKMHSLVHEWLSSQLTLWVPPKVSKYFTQKNAHLQHEEISSHEEL